MDDKTLMKPIKSINPETFGTEELYAQLRDMAAAVNFLQGYCRGLRDKIEELEKKR